MTSPPSVLHSSLLRCAPVESRHKLDREMKRATKAAGKGRPCSRPELPVWPTYNFLCQVITRQNHAGEWGACELNGQTPPTSCVGAPLMVTDQAGIGTWECRNYRAGGGLRRDSGSNPLNGCELAGTTGNGMVFLRVGRGTAITATKDNRGAVFDSSFRISSPSR